MQVCHDELTASKPAKTMLEQPLSTFIHPEEKSDYARFSIKLLAFPGVVSRPVPVSANRLHQANFTELLAPLATAPTHRQVFRVKTVKGTFEPVQFDSYLGAGFGANPTNRETLKLTYVVAKLTPVGGSSSGSGSGSNGSRSNTSSGSSSGGSPMAPPPGPSSSYGAARGRTSSFSYGAGAQPARAPTPTGPYGAYGRPPSRGGIYR